MNHRSSNTSALLQIQPCRADWDEWMALSLQEGLFFEPLEFFLPPANSDKDVLDDLKKWHQSSGRTRSLHGAFIDVNPACGDGELRALSRRRCHESCRLAVQLGARDVVFHASAHPFLRGAYLDSWAAECADFYTELSESYGLGIRVENSLDVDCTPLKALMERVGGDVAVCLDVGHAHYSQAPVEEWFDRLGEHIRYMHLSDNMGRFDDHLPIGAGSIDWEQVHNLWMQLERSMPVTLEVGGIDGVKRSLDFLRCQGYFGVKGRGPDE